jgi:hypothetical protein
MRWGYPAHLLGVGEQSGDGGAGGQGTDGADLDTSVTTVDGGVLDRDRLPGQRIDGGEQPGLVTADGEHVERVTAVQVAGVLTLGVHLVRGDHGAGHGGVVELVEQRLEHADFVGLVDRDLLLRGDGAVVGAGGEEHRGALSGPGGAVLGFPVDVQTTAQQTAVGVAVPGTGHGGGERAQDPVVVLTMAGQGLGEGLDAGPAGPAVAAGRGAQRQQQAVGCVGHPLADRGRVEMTGAHREHRQREQVGQRVPASP